jgi:hypothetical protein
MRRYGILIIALVAACDVSPTAVDGLERSSLEWLVTRGAPAGPAQRVLLDLVDRLESRQLAPGRLPGLDSLFQLAVLDESRLSAADADATRSAHRMRLEDAWTAIERGSRTHGEAELERARTYQAETIVRVLGPGAPVAWLSIVSRTLEYASRPDAARDRRGEPAAASRSAVALTARDLLADAREALGRGDTVTALDYATHAAGLVNLLLDRLSGLPPG